MAKGLLRNAGPESPAGSTRMTWVRLPGLGTRQPTLSLSALVPAHREDDTVILANEAAPRRDAPTIVSLQGN